MQPELPKHIWVDAGNLTVHLSPGDGLFPYSFVKPNSIRKPTRHHPHYKTEEEIAEIKRLSAEGLKQKDIAEKLGVRPRTVRKYAGTVYQKKAQD